MSTAMIYLFFPGNRGSVGDDRMMLKAIQWTPCLSYVFVEAMQYPYFDALLTVGLHTICLQGPNMKSPLFSLT